ncbi:hypothetical protein vseg_003841 [Gypsophila vaccaria]
MEGLSTHVYKGLQKYWNRRGYVRLHNNIPNETTGRAPARAPARPGPARPEGRRRRFWRVKISPRVRVWIRVGSPKRWLTRLRDAYVSMMLKISGKGFVGGLGGSGYGGSIEYGFGYGKGGQVVKEYDEKMIVEIYKSLMIAQGQLVASREGNGNNSNSNNNNNTSDNYNGGRGKIINGSQSRISVSIR